MNKARSLYKWTVLLALLALALGASASAKEKLVIMARPGDIPETIIKGFEEAYPNVEIEYIGAAWNEVDDKFQVLMATNQTLDVLFNFSVANWPDYVLMGLFHDLTPYVQRDKRWLDSKGVVPPAYEDVRTGSVVSAVSFQLRTGWMVFYNARLVDEAGLPRPPADWTSDWWDWPTFVQYCEKLTRRTPEGETQQWGVNFWDADTTAFNFTWAWGGDLLPAEAYEKGYAERVTFTRPENIAAFEAWHELDVKGVRGGSGNTDYYAQKTAMWVEVGDFWDRDFPWGVTAFPKGPAPRQPLATWPAFAGIPRTAKNPDLAWEFLKYVMVEGGVMRDDQGQWWRGGATMRSWQVRFETAQYSVLSRDQLLNFYMDGLTRWTRITPMNTVVGAGAFSIAQGAKSMWPLLNRVRSNEISVTAALTQAEAEINAYLAEQVKNKPYLK